MRSSRSRFALMLVLCSAAISGCGRKNASSASVISIVDEIIAGRNLDLRPVLEAYDPKRSDGDIVLFGPAVDVMPLSRYLVSCDRYDNVNGRPVKDRLPDFSGEVITRVVAMPKPIMEEDYVREVVLCLDTVTVRSLANGMTRHHRNPAKLIVLTSVDASARARHDLDSLFRAFSVESPVVLPMSLVADKIAAAGIASEKTVVISSQVDTLYAGWFSNFFVSGPEILAVTDSLDRIADHSVKTIVIDDYTTDADAVRAAHPGVNVFSTTEEVASFCYQALRRRNAFTHRIHYPKFDSFVALPDGDGNYLIVDSNGRYIQD